jgi:hypothetical protein
MNPKATISTLLLATIILATTINIAAASTYQTVTTITGTADKTTETFTVPSSDWRISWSYTATSSSNYSGISVVIFDGNGNALKTFNGGSEYSGVYDVTNCTAGNYYLDIHCLYVSSYTLTVEYQPSTASPSVPEFPTTAALIALISIASLACIVLLKKAVR